LEQTPIQLDYGREEPLKTNWTYVAFLFGITNCLISIGLLINMVIEIGHAFTANTSRFAADHAGSAVILLFCAGLTAILGYFFVRYSR
jgi:hypothetical protein